MVQFINDVDVRNNASHGGVAMPWRASKEGHSLYINAVRTIDQTSYDFGGNE